MPLLLEPGNPEVCMDYEVDGARSRSSAIAVPSAETSSTRPFYAIVPRTSH